MENNEIEPYGTSKELRDKIIKTMKSLREEVFDIVRAKCLSDDIALIAAEDLLQWFCNPNHSYSIIDNKRKQFAKVMRCNKGNKVKKACVNCVNNGTNCKISLDTEELFSCHLFNVGENIKRF